MSYIFHYNTMIKTQQQLGRMIDRLFVRLDSPEQQRNRELSLIVNPEILQIIFGSAKQADQRKKLELLTTICNLFRQNEDSSLLLYHRDCEIREHNTSILDDLVEFIFSLTVKKEEVQTIIGLFRPVVSRYVVTCRNIKKITGIISKDFYDGRFVPARMQLGISLLKVCLESQKPPETDPSSFFLFYGEGSGIKICKEKTLWGFSKGFSLYMSFMVHDVGPGAELAYFRVKQSDFCVGLKDDWTLTIKVFGETQLIELIKLKKNHWYSLDLEYVVKSKLFSKSFSLKILIDGQCFQKDGLPIPQITQNNFLQQLVFGRDLYGKINSIVLSRQTSAQIKIKWIDNWSQLESVIRDSKRLYQNLFLVYVPFITTQVKDKSIIYDISSRNHGQLLQNTIIYNNNFNQKSINYYGGMYNLLPFFYILRFHDQNQYPQLLEHLFEIVYTIFQNNFQQIQEESLNCKFFDIVGVHLAEASPDFLTVKAIKLLSGIIDKIRNEQLRQEIFKMLWKINIKSIKNEEIIIRLMEIINTFYRENPSLYSSLWNIESFLHYISQNFQPIMPQYCCYEHFQQNCIKNVQIEENDKMVTNSYRPMAPVFELMVYVCRVSLESNFSKAVDTLALIAKFLHSDHSQCYTNLLLKLFSEIYQMDIRELKSKLVKQCSLVHHLYQVLNRTTHYDTLQLLIRLLYRIYQSDKDEAPRIIYMLTAHFKKMNINKSQTLKSRSISDDVIQQRQFLHRQSLTDISSPEESADLGELAQRIKIRKKNISNYRPLMMAILQLVIPKAGQRSENSDTHIALDNIINEEGLILLLQYYQLSCILFKKEILLTIWEAVMNYSVDAREDARNNSFFLLYFLCRILVSSKLDVNLDCEHLKQIQHHIIEIFKAIAMTTHESSTQFCNIFLRLQSVLFTVKKDMELSYQASERPMVSFVCRLVSRRFLLSLINSGEFCTNSCSIMAMSFAVYSCLFCSSEEDHAGQQKSLLEYFGFLEKQLFIASIDTIPEHITHYFPNKKDLVFVDSTLVQALVSQLDIFKYKFCDNIYSKVGMYLDPNFSQEFSKLKQILFREVNNNEEEQNRKSEFLDFFQSLFQRSMIEEVSQVALKQLKQKRVVVVETLILMLQIKLQFTLRNTEKESFLLTLSQLQQLIKITILVCQNNGTNSKQADQSQQQIVRKLVLQVLHCLYNLMENELDISYNEQLEASLHRLFVFIYANIDNLNQKVGNVNTFEELLHFGGIIHNAEKYSMILVDLFDKHVRDEKKNKFITLSHVKEIKYMDQAKIHEEIFSDNYKSFFKKGKFVTKLLTSEIQRELREVQGRYREAFDKQCIETKLRLTVQNFGHELTKETAERTKDQQAETNQSLMLFLKQQNFDLRASLQSWGKIWDQLRLYHYGWSIWMDQREDKGWQWENRRQQNPYILRKFSKYQSDNGLRPFLQVKLIEPWHVRKRQIQREISYMNQDYHYNFFKSHNQKNSDIKQFRWLKLFRRDETNQEDEFKVEWIKHNSKRKGTIKLLETKLQFAYDSIYQKDSHMDFTHFRLAEFKPILLNWDLVQLKNVTKRRYLMKHNCLLFEFENNTQEIFNFTDEKIDIFLQLLSKKQKSHAQDRLLHRLNHIKFYTDKFNYELGDVSGLLRAKTEEWEAHKISNFDYLLFLNKMAGRSFYDPTQYPVMPWIISDFSCRQLIYRPLDKTMGALGSQTRKQMIKEKCKAFDPFNNVPIYQYGTHYSSPGVIFNYLIRLSPYTQAARVLQGGKFDISDRIFYSLLWCWRSATTEMSDVRQLCPQFYYMPQFLLNIEYHNFGVTQQKERVHNVDLPIWADGDPYNFITIHRKAFESEQVSKGINNWIDLIFGFKQKGKQAEENMNLFYYLTYENAVNLDEIEDEVSKTSAEAQIVHFGQTPCQLFNAAHPKREEKSKKKWSVTKPICQMFVPKTTNAVEWDDIYSKAKSPILALHLNGSNLTLMKSNCIVEYELGVQQPHFQRETAVNLKKTKNEIFIADLTFNSRVVFFSQYLATAFSLNGQLRIYNQEGTLVESQAGAVKNCIYVNKRQDLILTGGKDSLFEVYEIIYKDKDQLSLVSIATENLLDSINHISEGGGFYSVCSGNIVSIYNIYRSAAYIHKKTKKVRCKFIRSYMGRNKINGARIFTCPLFGVAFYDSTTLWSYSANGQLLTTKSISIRLQPQILKDNMNMEHLTCLTDSQVVILSTPNLSTVRTIKLPSKFFICWKITPEMVLLGCQTGQIIVVNDEKEQ